MDMSRAVAAATVLLILSVTLATGPLVGVSLTTAEKEQFEPGSGTINATVVSTPDRATLEAAKYGIEKYHLRAQPVELHIEGATGQPTVSYEIYIEELSYTRSSVTFLDSSVDGTYQLEFKSARLDHDRINRDQYKGILRIVVIDQEQTLTETEIQIEVTE